MSVINLHCDEIYWGTILQTIALVQATDIVNDPYIGDNGVEMTEGRFGLTISNDPFIVFSQQPKKITDIEISDVECINKWDYELVGDVETMHELYIQCVACGWDEKERLGLWLCNRIADFILKNKPLTTYLSISKLSGRVNL